MMITGTATEVLRNSGQPHERPRSGAFVANQSELTFWDPALERERCWLTATSRSRIADAITRCAGSMPFVYVHMIWFTAWIALEG
jgi:uncharacterized membrane protein